MKKVLSRMIFFYDFMLTFVIDLTKQNPLPKRIGKGCIFRSLAIELVLEQEMADAL